jgi:hypothetical protein
MKYPKRSQYKHAKSQYRLQNWPEYEAGLQKRGDLTVWLSDAALDAWRGHCQLERDSREHGRSLRQESPICGRFLPERYVKKGKNQLKLTIPNTVV